jgi:prepilin-type N-terminal cleavage/methylation domain-containing protein
MKAMASKIGRQNGFTLVEIIITLVAAGIMGVIFSSFMESALKGSSRSVEYVRDETDGIKVMEQIIGDYVREINSDPDNVLETIIAKKGAGDYGSRVDMQYIVFNASGTETPSPGTTNTLKITIQASGKNLVNILTRGRHSGDPLLRY